MLTYCCTNPKYVKTGIILIGCTSMVITGYVCQYKNQYRSDK